MSINNELLHTAIKAAFHGGQEILEVYHQSDFTVEWKEDDSPLTQADKAANRVIKKYLEQTGIPILSEEGKEIDYKERKHWDKFWLVDPLDGTKEFIKRNGEFTVNIALIENNLPTLGVILVPETKELYFAEKELGAFKKDDFKKEMILDQILFDAHKLPLTSGPNTFTVVASRSHMSEETQQYIDELKAKHGNVETLSRGSSLKLCMVAEGKANVYPRFAPTMEWDTGAGHAIARISGADVLNNDTGRELHYNKENLRNPWFVVKRSDMNSEF